MWCERPTIKALRELATYADPAFWLGEAADAVRRDPHDAAAWRTLSRCNRALGQPFQARITRAVVRTLPTRR